MATKLKQIQSLKQKLAPRQVLQARLLQLNTVNLEQAIIEELEQNPLLEQVEAGEVQPEQNSDETPIDEIDVSMEDMYSDESTYYLSEQKSEMPLPDRHTLLEDLIDQLKDLNLNENEKEVAEEIIWNTNEKGYLDTDLILIADRFDLLENEVEPILHKVQRLNPLGIGSRSLEECLMIQLEDEKGSLSHKIVNKYFDDFMHKRYEKIQEKLNCTKGELHEAVDQISHLSPHPGEGYLDRFQTVFPDVIVREDGDDWVITTNDGGLPELRISQAYESQMNDDKLKSDAKRFIKDKMDLANWFIEAIHQRRVTMVNVMRLIIKFQPEWFAGNMNYLRPLKLQDIADVIKMDISTVSRIVKSKNVQTDYGIFPLRYFFSESTIKKGDDLVSSKIVKNYLSAGSF